MDIFESNIIFFEFLNFCHVIFVKMYKDTPLPAYTQWRAQGGIGGNSPPPHFVREINFENHPHLNVVGFSN